MSSQPSLKPIRDEAIHLTRAFASSNRDRIAAISARGYGAFALSEILNEAWRCAQSGNPVQWPKSLMRYESPETPVHPKPPAPSSFGLGGRIPQEIRDFFCKGVNFDA